MYSKGRLPDTEQWSRAEAPTSSRGGLILALLASGLIDLVLCEEHLEVVTPTVPPLHFFFVSVTLGPRVQ